MHQTGRRLVLVVEDDDQTRELIKVMLESAGYEVAGAGNGREAMTFLQESGPACVILLDLMMPVMDGWAFRHEQRQDPTLAEIPVVVVSAIDNIQGRVAGLDITDHITKPIDINTLLETVQRYCGA